MVASATPGEQRPVTPEIAAEADAIWAERDRRIAAAKARVRAKVDAASAMSAREYVYNLLSATRTHAEAEAMLAEIEANAPEVDRLRAELAEVKGAAVCPSVADLYDSRCALPVRHRGDHRNAAKNHFWSDEHAVKGAPGGER